MYLTLSHIHILPILHLYLILTNKTDKFFLSFAVSLQYLNFNSAENILNFIKESLNKSVTLRWRHTPYHEKQHP